MPARAANRWASVGVCVNQKSRRGLAELVAGFLGDHHVEPLAICYLPQPLHQPSRTRTAEQQTAGHARDRRDRRWCRREQAPAPVKLDVAKLRKRPCGVPRIEIELTTTLEELMSVGRAEPSEHQRSSVLWAVWRAPPLRGIDRRLVFMSDRHQAPPAPPSGVVAYHLALCKPIDEIQRLIGDGNVHLEPGQYTRMRVGSHT